MPRSKSDLSHSSPKIKFYEPRYTSSLPIEIPSKRRPVDPCNDSPPKCSISPELIFEMSPVTSGIPSSSLRDFGLLRSASDLDTNEPFTYSFPKIPVLQNCTNSGNRTQPMQTSALSNMGPALAASVAPSATTKQAPLLAGPNINDGRAPAVPLTRSGTVVTKSHSTTKITGFTPLTPMSMRLSSPTRSSKTMRLSPPPRSPSYSSSPWILPGKSEAQDSESGSLESDLGSFEFKRHLMRRIENQTPSRFRRIAVLSSMRV